MSLFSKEDRDTAMEYMDKKLRNRVRMFFVILFIMIAVLGYDLYKDQVTIVNILVGVIIGTLVGLIVGRMFKIYWHPTDRKVMARLDAIGIGALVLYLAFAFSRDWIFAHFVQASHLKGFVFSTVAGVMIGRILTMSFHIKKVIATNVENPNQEIVSSG